MTLTFSHVLVINAAIVKLKDLSSCGSSVLILSFHDEVFNLIWPDVLLSYVLLKLLGLYLWPRQHSTLICIFYAVTSKL